MTRKPIVGTWLSLVERTLGVGEVASSNLVVPTIYFQSLSVWEKELPVNPVGFLAHDVVVLLDPKDIVENIHDAYDHSCFS